MDFDAVLDAAEQEPAETLQVQVCLRPSVAKKRSELLKRLEDAREEDARDSQADPGRLSAPSEPVTVRQDAVIAELDAIEDEVEQSLVTLRFTRVDGDKWAALTLANPIRINVTLDRHYGYNVDAVSVAAARLSGVRVDEDGDHELTVEQWDRLYKLLSGHDQTQIRDAVWTLNEYAPTQLTEALVKSYGAA